MTFSQQKKRKIPFFGFRQGLTLVELLTVMLLGAILISMALLIYVTTSRSYMRQDSLVEQMLNLRSALAFISRDLRMAGSGFSLLNMGQKHQILVYNTDADGHPTTWFRYDNPTPMSYGVQPLWFLGKDDGPDILTVAYMAPEFSAPLGRLSDEYSANDPTLKLRDLSLIEYSSAIDDDEVLMAGDNIAVVDGDRAVILEATSGAADGLGVIRVKATPSSFPSGYLHSGSSFSSESLVYNIRKIYVHSFRVDTTNNTLVMDTLGETGDLLAEGIEDLQVAFTVAKTDPTVDTNLIQTYDDFNLESKDKTLARIVLVSKSTTKDPYLNTYPLIQALDHKPVGSDQYRRRSLETVVNLRNF
ncbi:MAG: PilW family protein [Deltaproteobacteria bacterium]|jgi:prepilin-type N-terminal cleavage/methylation domain-containing protein|nr:PilW family protein [Deltaproteobacteria bacterium]